MADLLSLSLVEADILWEELGLGALPAPFEIRSVGTTMDERAAIRRDVWADLAERGLARRGRLEPEIEDQLAVLVRYESAISVFGVLEEEKVLRGRVSGTSQFAVLAMQGTTHLHIEIVPAQRLSVSIVDALPNARPFPGRPVTIRDHDPKSSAYLHPVTTPSADELLAGEMLSARRTRAGYFTAHGRDRRGHHVQSAELAWTDTVRGRFSSRVYTKPNGDRFATHAPANNASLAADVRELLAWVHADD